MYNQRTITLDQIISWESCEGYTIKRIKKLFGRKRRASIMEILNSKIPIQDRFWVVLREELIPANTLHEAACRFAEQALKAERKAGREPDPRSWAAIQAKRDRMTGKITDNELADVRNAADAVRATAAARATVRAATRAAAQATAAYSWAAAQSVADAQVDARIAATATRNTMSAIMWAADAAMLAATNTTDDVLNVALATVWAAESTARATAQPAADAADDTWVAQLKILKELLIKDEQ